MYFENKKSPFLRALKIYTWSKTIMKDINIMLSIIDIEPERLAWVVFPPLISVKAGTRADVGEKSRTVITVFIICGKGITKYTKIAAAAHMAYLTKKTSIISFISFFGTSNLSVIPSISIAKKPLAFAVVEIKLRRGSGILKFRTASKNAPT